MHFNADVSAMSKPARVMGQDVVFALLGTQQHSLAQHWRCPQQLQRLPGSGAWPRGCPAAVKPSAPQPEAPPVAHPHCQCVAAALVQMADPVCNSCMSLLQLTWIKACMEKVNLGVSLSLRVYTLVVQGCVTSCAW